MSVSAKPSKSPRKASGMSASSSKLSLIPTPTKQTFPRDLKDALSWLRLSGLTGLEKGMLSKEAFLKPWAHYRDVYLLLQPRDSPRTSPLGSISPADILHYYTWYDEGALRYDASADENSPEYEPDPSRRAVLDKTEWRVEEHEKFLYAWLLQTFKVGKSFNEFGFNYFECKNIVVAWREVLVPIVRAVIADYDIRGRRYYGRLAKFIEEASPSRLAFPEANVVARVKALEQPKASRDTPPQAAGETDPFTNIWISKKGKKASECEAEEIDRELRVAFPGFGHLVEKPKTDVKEWVNKQSEALAQKQELHGRQCTRNKSELRLGERVRRAITPAKKLEESSPKPLNFSRKRGDSNASYPSLASTNTGHNSSRLAQSPESEQLPTRTKAQEQADVDPCNTFDSLGGYSGSESPYRDGEHGAYDDRSRETVFLPFAEASRSQKSGTSSLAYTEPGFGPDTYDPFFEPHHVPQDSFASSGDNHNVYHNFQREQAKEKMSPSRQSLMRGLAPLQIGKKGARQATESFGSQPDKKADQAKQYSRKEGTEPTSMTSLPSYISTEASSSRVPSQASGLDTSGYSGTERNLSDNSLKTIKPSRIPSPVYASKSIYSYAPRAATYRPTGMPRDPISPVDKNKDLPPAPAPVPPVPVKNPRRYNSTLSTSSSLAASSLAPSLPKSRSNRLIAEESSSSLLGPRAISKENIRAALGHISMSSRESLVDDLEDPIVSPATTQVFAGMGGRGLNTGEDATARKATPVLRTYNSHMFPRRKESMNTVGTALDKGKNREDAASNEYEMGDLKKKAA